MNVQELKEKTGFVETPLILVDKMLNFIPNSIWKRSDVKWLDPCAGYGIFGKEIVKRLSEENLNLSQEKIKKGVKMIEIEEGFIKKLESEGYNIECNDFLEWSAETTERFDVIVGNPPYNFGSIKKVPSNSKKDKRMDGKTIWPDFIKQSLKILKPDGYLCFITPALWLKPDKAGIHDLLIKNKNYQLKMLYSMTDVETNKVFKGEAQTPTTIFLIQKTDIQDTSVLWDSISNNFIKYKYTRNFPIPLYAVTIVEKILNIVSDIGSINVEKTNTISKKIGLSAKKTETHIYPAVLTCILSRTINTDINTNTYKTPLLITEYSDAPCPYYGESKIILAHKRFGFPYIDKPGEFGISKRDNYIILSSDPDYLQLITAYLSSKFARVIFGVTAYRMKYLERYVFELLPDISKITNCKKIPVDNDLFKLFGLSEAEINFIEKYHKYEYGNFINN